MSILPQVLVTGVMLGLVYGLVAIGFVLICKCSGIVNFAQGQMVMIGGYIAYAVLVQLHANPLLGILITIALAFILGLGMQRFILRPLIGQSLLTLVMATMGFSVLLQGIVVLGWGYAGIKVYPPGFMPKDALISGVVTISQQQLWIFLVCVVFLVAFALFFRFSRIGLNMRAVAESHFVTRSLGVNVNGVVAIVCGVSGVVSAVGGVLLGTMNGIQLGTADIGLRAIPAALVGGMESLPGAVIGGMIIGLAESLAACYIGRGTGGIVAYVIMIGVLLIRPYGLFGLKKIERV